MSLRRRLTLMSALVVGVTVVLASIVAYAAMRDFLRGQVDDALLAQGARIQRLASVVTGGSPQKSVPGLPERAGGPAPFTQIIDPRGRVLAHEGEGVTIPVEPGDETAAGDTGEPLLSDREADGVHLRVITVPLAGAGAVQLARPLGSVDDTLQRLRILLALLCIGGTAFAAAMSRLFSAPVVKPITDLTAAAEHVEATGDLGRRIEGEGTDEVGRMTTRFNAMLDRLQGSQEALAASTAAQRQLVADASHELRTPITSLRTNMEVLLAGGALDEADRRALLRDVVDQTEELGELITDVIDLARGDPPRAELEDVRFDQVVAEAVDRARRHAPDVEFRTQLEPTTIQAAPDRLGRAVNNLLDNAAKYSPPGGAVDVTLAAGELAVRDHGPGVPEADLPHIFDRFFRGANARGREGSGLGLAIVKQVAEAHGGAVGAEQAGGGGLRVRLRLPAHPDEPEPPRALPPPEPQVAGRALPPAAPAPARAPGPPRG